MSYVAAGVSAGVGAAGEVVGDLSAAGAASKAARAQQQAAEQYHQYVQRQQNQATSQVLNPAALAAHDQALKSQQANVNRQNALVASLDPNIIEAGKQTAQLLQGKSAPVLAEIQNQRNAQRQQLQSQLTQQMGPGGASSSAGQQALAKFDLDTANMMNSTQQQYLDKVSNISMGGAKTLGESLSAVNEGLTDINSNSPQNKAAQLISQFTNGAGAAAEAATVNAAGGQYRGQQLLGQMTSQLGGSLIQGGAMLAAGGLTKGAGGDYTQADQDKDINEFADTMGAGGAPATAGAAPNLDSAVSQIGKNQMQRAGTLGATTQAPGMAGGSGYSPSARSTLGFSTNYGNTYNPATAGINQYAQPQTPPFNFQQAMSAGTNWTPNIAGGNQ